MVEVRPEANDDGAAIRAVHLAAFATPAEADLVEQLKADGDATISLVAVEESLVVGHVLFSRMSAVADGERLDALGLGPVAVLPKRQRQGIGSALIEAGLRQAESLGAGVVFVVGDPDYYGRFGFAAEAAAPFASLYAGRHFQAKPLQRDLQMPASGRADYAPAFSGLE